MFQQIVAVIRFEYFLFAKILMLNYFLEFLLKKIEFLLSTGGKEQLMVLPSFYPDKRKNQMKNIVQKWLLKWQGSITVCSVSGQRERVS